MSGDWAIITAPMDRMLEATARAEDSHYWFRGLRRHARLLLDQVLEGRRLDRIVDCGAGTGRNLDWLADYGSAVGFEWSPAGLRMARQHNRQVARATVAALPLADASVDLATSFDVLYCLDDATERLALAEMWRVLKPGGLMLTNVAALDILHGAHSTLTMELRRYTPSRLRSRLTDARFRVERMTFTYMTQLPFALAIRGFQRLTGQSAEALKPICTRRRRHSTRLSDAVLRVEAALLRVANRPSGRRGWRSHARSETGRARQHASPPPIRAAASPHEIARPVFPRDEVRAEGEERLHSRGTAETMTLACFRREQTQAVLEHDRAQHGALAERCFCQSA